MILGPGQPIAGGGGDADVGFKVLTLSDVSRFIVFCGPPVLHEFSKP